MRSRANDERDCNGFGLRPWATRHCSTAAEMLTLRDEIGAGHGTAACLALRENTSSKINSF